VVHHSGDLTKVDRFPPERWTTSTGIVDRFAPESVDHFDRNTHAGGRVDYLDFAATIDQ